MRAAGAWERRARVLDPYLVGLARELFAGAHEVLTVGVRAALEPSATTFAEEPGQGASLHHDFDGVLWLLAAQAAKRAVRHAREAEPGDWSASETAQRAILSASEMGSGSPRAGLAILRPRLRPEAPVLLIARARPPALAQLRALLLVPLARASARFDARERTAQRPSIESLCEAVLLAGLCAPRVHRGRPGWLAVSARMPSVPTALDSFFEQPAPTSRR